MPGCYGKASHEEAMTKLLSYHFYHLECFMTINQQNLYLFNQAYIVLIPKKECPPSVSDY
jgi:hypothetical protein